jgi:hypothetical protein
MPLDCPICNPSVQELPGTGDASGFHCPTHGDFKVANTVFEEEDAKNYTRQEWEAALDKAKQRTDPEEEGPLIITDDFY